MAFTRTTSKNPEALVDEALASFNEALKKMEEATTTIEAGNARLEEQIAAIQVKIDAGNIAKERLSRVNEKLKEFLQ